jgi:drug/metabolite transporter (DMT)-like permease
MLNKKSYSGILYMLSAQAMFALMAACVRGLKELAFMEIVFVRSAAGVLMFGGYMLVRRLPFRGTHQLDLCMRGFTGFLALVAYYFAITHLPLATATLLANTAPILVAILAGIFLKERIKPQLALLIFLCLYGVFLLVSPEFSLNAIGYTTGITAAFFIALAFFYIRKLSTENPFTIIFYFVSISSIGSAPWAISAWQWPTGMQWAPLSVIAATTYLGQLWLTLSFQYGSAALISAMGYSGPVFAWLLGLAFFHETLTESASLGASIIVLSGSAFIYLNKKL